MALLSEETRAQIAAEFHRSQSTARAPIDVEKDGVEEVIAAMDTAYDGFRTAFEAIMPKAYSSLERQQQLELLVSVIQHREAL